MAKTVEQKFRKIRHFKPHEFDAPERLDDDSLILLDEMRHEEAKTRDIFIVVNADFALTGHSANSRHAFGDAYDLSIKDGKTRKPLPVMDQFRIASNYTWGGIGIYPFWNSPGIHVDRRPWSVFRRRATWYRNAAGEYLSINEYMKEFGV